MNIEKKIKKTIKLLSAQYPKAICSLNYSSPLQFLICARLSAHCTDKMVNLVTPALFSKFQTIEDFAAANITELQKYIKPCGLYKVKSQSIIQMCKEIINRFDGEIPKNIKSLSSLPGIGRKTANLFLGEIYAKPGIIVDTHFSRVTKRLGFHNLNDPVKIEYIMKDIVPEEESIKFCHRVVWHGREVCKARKPLCETCILKEICNYFSSI